MTRDELTSIRNHGTVLLFVTFLHRDGAFHGRTHYALLQPYFIDLFLDDFPKKQKSFAVPVKELPRTTDEIERLVALGIRSQKQSVSFGSVDALIERGKNFTIHGADDLDFSKPLTISPRHGDFIIEVETHDGLVAPLSGVMKIYPPTYTPRNVPLRARCGDVEYVGATIRQVDADVHTLSLSDGLTLNLHISDRLESASAVLTFVSNFADRSRDLAFFNALVANQPLYIDGKQQDVDITEPERISDLVMIQRRMDMLSELFEELHVDTSLVELARMTDEEYDQLSYIHGSLLHGRSLRSSGDEPPLFYAVVADWKVALFLLPDGDKQALQCADPFAPTNRDRFKLFSTDEAGGSIERQATVYDTLDSRQLAEYVNTNLDQLVPAYEAVADVQGTLWLAVRTMLNLVRAADACEPRRVALLNAANSLNEWIDGKTGPSITAILNRLQIAARRPNGLSDDNRRAVRSLRRTIIASGDGDAAVNETACAILLGDAEDIQECAHRLSEAELDELREYPIWNLVPTSLSFSRDHGK
ncbi:hypothetical protein AB0O90_04725 [Microbacterium testaceum]|uniref:hypothetical protein n=1 Tax=Microbacterium testaceum TaxID=2033 RepID=UPI00341C3DB0